MGEWIRCPACNTEAKDKNVLVIMQTELGYLYYCRKCRMVWEE